MSGSDEVRGDANGGASDGGGGGEGSWADGAYAREVE